MNNRLNIINAMLSIVGESAVDSLDTAHPDVVSASAFLDSNRSEILGQGWWFNKRTMTFTRDINGHIYIPATTITVDSTDNSKNLAIRDGKLFDVDNQTYIFTENQELETVVDLTEDEIPPVPLAVIKHSSVVEFAANSQVTGLAVNIAMGRLEKAEERLNALRFRHADTSFSNNVLNQRMQRFKNHYAGTKKSGFYGRYSSKLKKQ